MSNTVLPEASCRRHRCAESGSVFLLSYSWIILRILNAFNSRSPLFRVMDFSSAKFAAIFSNSRASLSSFICMQRLNTSGLLLERHLHFNSRKCFLSVSYYIYLDHRRIKTAACFKLNTKQVHHHQTKMQTCMWKLQKVFTSSSSANVLASFVPEDRRSS